MKSNDQAGSQSNFDNKISEDDHKEKASKKNGQSNNFAMGLIKNGTNAISIYSDSQNSKDKRLERKRLSHKQMSQKSDSGLRMSDADNIVVRQKSHGNAQSQNNSNSSDSSIDGLPGDIVVGASKGKVLPSRKQALREGTMAQYNYDNDNEIQDQ